MPSQRDFTTLRLQLAEALYAAKECADVYHLLPEVGLTHHPDERVEYQYPSIAPWDLSAVLTTIFALVEFGNFRKKNIFDGFYEVPSEVGELLERNDGAWRIEIEEIAQAKRRTAAQQQSIIHFIGELLEIAIPNSYLEKCPPQWDDFDDSSSLPIAETTLDTLNVEERLLLIDKLWIPDWSAPLSKSARRVIGLVLAAIDGRPYATPFVEIWGLTRPLVLPKNLELAFGLSENEASTALTKAIFGVIELTKNEDFVPPFDFNT
jgi:hypothetical protein